ncbi:MAG TPA: M23 family metallopeptidase [Egibacteraceae bacterium]
MIVQPLGAATSAPATAGTSTATDSGAFAALLQRELSGAAATPAAGAMAAAATPVTFGQMIAMTAGTAAGDPTVTDASALAQAAAAQLAAAPSTAATAVTPVTADTPGGLVLPVEGRFSSPFGMRTHPVTGARKMHTGVDIAAPTGTPIRAARGGTVSFAGVRGGYGNLVIIDHPDGTQTRYAHQDALQVQVGQRVAAGQVVGTVGSTGMSTGPHLHFELRRGGDPVDPAPLLGLHR